MKIIHQYIEEEKLIVDDETAANVSHNIKNLIRNSYDDTIELPIVKLMMAMDDKTNRNMPIVFPSGTINRINRFK